MWRTNANALLLIVVLFGAVTIDQLALASSKRRGATIVSPKRNADVERLHEVIGKLHVPGQPVVLVRPEQGDGTWWIQPAPTLTERGYFTAEVRFGSSTSRRGDRFSLVVIVLQSPADIEYLRDREALPEIPNALYRDVADGADGMIAHGRELLEYADRHGRAIVYIGVETFRYEPTPIWFATGLSRERFHAVLASKGEHIARISRLNDFRLRTLDDGQRISIGIELPQPLASDAEQLAQKTMLEIAKPFGVPERPDDSIAAIHHIAKFIEDDAEWSDLRSRPIVDAESASRYDGFLVDSIMLSKITFADNSAEDFQTQVRAAEQYFRRYKRYGGTAIHYYEPFRDKLAESGRAKVPND